MSVAKNTHNIRNNKKQIGIYQEQWCQERLWTSVMKVPYSSLLVSGKVPSCASLLELGHVQI